MRNAILVPGRPDKDQHYDPSLPSNSEEYWFSWLKRKLILRDVHTISIEPPMPFRPRYDEWEKEFERCDITPETILVGHSCGGGFLIRYLSEHKELHVGQVVLVAPWTNPYDNLESDTADFFDFEIDANFPSRTAGVTVFYSTDDDKSVVETVTQLTKTCNDLTVKKYSDRGHFKQSEFVELISSIQIDV
ncbi:MAG: alpha/beta hydrolase [Candidatus Saccharimonadales bacterium]